VAELGRQLGFEVADMGALANAPLVESAATIWITLAYRQRLAMVPLTTGCRVGESPIPGLRRG